MSMMSLLPTFWDISLQSMSKKSDLVKPSIPLLLNGCRNISGDVKISCGDAVATLWLTKLNFQPLKTRDYTPLRVTRSTSPGFQLHNLYNLLLLIIPSCLNHVKLPRLPEMEMASLQTLIQSASTPELKALLTLFKSRCPRSNELSQRLQGSFPVQERGSKEFFSHVVEEICDKFPECKEAAYEILTVDEDELPDRSWVLDGSQEESELEAELVRKKKKKRKRDLLSSPLKQKERKKVKGTSDEKKSTLLPPTIPGWWPDVSVVQNKSRTLSACTAPPSAAKKKRTIEEIFEVDRQRREAEALQEAERLAHEKEIQATCAQCKKFFLTDDNWDDSCVFHSGK